MHFTRHEMNLTSKPEISAAVQAAAATEKNYRVRDEPVCGRAHLSPILGTKSNERNGSTSALCVYFISQNVLNRIDSVSLSLSCFL